MCTVFILVIFCGEFPQPKNLTVPPNSWQIVCSRSFFGRDSELQIYHGNFLSVDSKHRKLFVIKQPEGCKIRLAVVCLQLRVGARLYCRQVCAAAGVFLIAVSGRLAAGPSIAFRLEWFNGLQAECRLYTHSCMEYDFLFTCPCIDCRCEVGTFIHLCLEAMCATLLALCRRR